MNKKIYATIIIILLCKTMLFTQENNDTFSYSPIKPINGEELTINFNPQNTDLEREQNVEVIIYSIRPGHINCYEYPMEKAGKSWIYKYIIPDTTNCIALRFRGGEKEVYDDGKNFPVFLYDENGKMKKGTRGSFADICFKGDYNAKPDLQLAYSLYEKELKENPSMLKTFAKGCAFCAVKNDEALTKLVKLLENEENPDENTLETLWFLNRKLSNRESTSYYYKLIIEKYPLGRYAQLLAQSKIKSQATNPDSLKKSISEFQAKYGKHSLWLILTLLRGDLLKMYCEKEMYSSAKDYIQNNIDEFKVELEGIKQIYQTAEIIAKAGKDFDPALELIDRSLKLVMEFKAGKDKYPQLTKSQIESKINYYKIEALYYAGLVHEEMGKPEEAIRYVERANSFGEQFHENVLKILHAKLLVELNRDIDKALKFSEDIISEGTYTEEVAAINKKAYRLEKGSDEGYEDYLRVLRKPVLDKLREKIEPQLINKPAPDFSLTDLEGNVVTLSELKGKTVILDFWATWCGPCKASMPLMKDAIKRYANNENVAFLFIDTFERGEGYKDKVRQFISDNNYPFNVLFDEGSKVASEYGIVAIPAKVFIDKDGNQRFLSKGFNEEEILDEIDVLIKILE
ncbi:MAG: redoxin domain-containing protein [Ignavibacteria bacterium]|jgi:thiol-disulfide isomerase/thioredoxin